MANLHSWMKNERARLSRHAHVAKAMDYMLTRWSDFTGFLNDGRICLTNNAAERSLRGVALGRKSWMFAGSQRGGDRAAFMYTLIVTTKLNNVDPQAWLAGLRPFSAFSRATGASDHCATGCKSLARIADTPMSRLDRLLPWNWAADQKPAEVKAA